MTFRMIKVYCLMYSNKIITFLAKYFKLCKDTDMDETEPCNILVSVQV